MRTLIDKYSYNKVKNLCIRKLFKPFSWNNYSVAVNIGLTVSCIE